MSRNTSTAFHTIGISEIERSDTEPQHSGFAVVADDAPRDESLHDRIALGMNKTHVRSTTLMFARRDQLQTVGSATLLDEVDEEIGQRERLAPNVGHVSFERDVETTFDKRQRRDRLSTTEKAPYSCAGFVGRLHRKWSRVPPTTRTAAGFRCSDGDG